MNVEFGAAGRGTVGLEWEMFLVDLETRELSPRAPEVLEALGAGKDTPVRGEYLSCMVELVTSVHTSIPDAVAELRGLLAGVQAEAGSRGLGVLASGSHPFSRAADQPVVDTPHYDVVRRRNAWWGRRMIVSGVHVHVAVGDADLAMPVTQGLARFYPYFLALSASSPFWEGEDTGFASQRTMMFQQLATNGLPADLHTWAEFESYAEELHSARMISKPTEIRWDVRPAPRFGTVENRIPDSSPTLTELGCVAAWTQVVAEYIMRETAAGRSLQWLSPWLVAENKWRAARYGLEAEVITPDPTARHLPLREGIHRLLDRLAPTASDLGCLTEFIHAEEILAHGASYERQRRVAAESGGDLVAVVDALLAENKEGTPQ